MLAKTVGTTVPSPQLVTVNVNVEPVDAFREPEQPVAVPSSRISAIVKPETDSLNVTVHVNEVAFVRTLPENVLMVGAMVSFVIVPGLYAVFGPVFVLGNEAASTRIVGMIVPSLHPVYVATYTDALVALTDVVHPVAVPVRVMSDASNPVTSKLNVKVVE